MRYRMQVNRDTMSFATKLSHMVYADGSARDVMKHPKTDATKFSLPGAPPGLSTAPARLPAAGRTTRAGSGAPAAICVPARPPLARAGGSPCAADPCSKIPAQNLNPAGDPVARAGVLAVKRVGGVPTVFPADGGEVAPEEDLLQVRPGWQ